MTTTDFLDKYEQTQPRWVKQLCDSFIKSMKDSNPQANMVGSDWLHVMIQDYTVDIDEDKGLVSFIPKELKTLVN